ncbi:MAG: SPW repeat protein [Patescibacteria group bacterium]|nr:SPW repeat protein [Patescibacteria group bacterium]
MNNFQKTHFSAIFLNLIAGIWIVLSPWLINFLGINSTWGVMVAGAVVVVASMWFLFKTGVFRFKKRMS